MKIEQTEHILATPGTRPCWGLAAMQPSSSASRRGRLHSPSTGTPTATTRNFHDAPHARRVVASETRAGINTKIDDSIMNTKSETMVQERPVSPTVTFQSTKATKVAAHALAMRLGRSVLHQIAENLGSESEPCFRDDGVISYEMDAVLYVVATNAFEQWLSEAWVEEYFKRDVVNQMRENLGLKPIS